MGSTPQTRSQPLWQPNSPACSVINPICEATGSVACTTVAPTTCSAGSYLDQSTNTCKQCGPGFYLAYSADGTYDNQAPCLAW